MTAVMPRESGISPVQMWILFILSDGPDYGYKLIQRLDKLFAGHWKPKPGTIYPALDKLAQDGYVSRIHEHREEGPRLVCRDGAVFPYDRVEDLAPVEDSRP